MSRETEGGANTGSRRLASAALAVGLVVSALAVAPGTTAAQSNGTNGTFIVEQGSQCTGITPLGDGTKTVEEFYNYDVLNDTANYSSLGTVDIQQDQTSQLFVYRGSEGLSLVFLHDKINTSGGFVATADLSGLPSDGEWAVEDDNYTNRDDSFNYTDTGAHIEWNSNGERTDGAVFRGLGSSNYTTIEADIKFNERVDRYPFEEWAGTPEQNQIERWIVRSGTGDTTELDLDQPIQISPGTCDGGVSTFTQTPTSTNGSNATTTSGTSAPTASDTATTTATQTATPTTTATATQMTAATTSGVEPTTQASNADEGGETTDNDTGTVLGTGTANESGGNGSGAFGPGFGVGIGLLAVLLAVGALVRRQR